MAREIGLITVFRGKVDVPITLLRVRFRELLRIPERVYALVHVEDVIGVTIRHTVKAAVFNAKAKEDIRLGDEHDWKSAFRIVWFDDVAFEHL